MYPRGGGGINRNAGDGAATPGSGSSPGSDFGADGIPGDVDDDIGGIGPGGPGGVTPGENAGPSPGGIDDNSIDEPFPGDTGNRDGFDGNRNGNRPGGDSDFPKRDRGFGTVITNSGDTFFNIAPGASARAHVQNIDLKPYGEDGALSPSEALRRDERRSLRLRFRG